MSNSSSKSWPSGPSSSFDYQRFIARRERLANTVFVFFVVWWTILMVVGIGSHWWEPMDSLKKTALWGDLTVDRFLALGALMSMFVAIGGPWLVRNLHRPPQLFLLLRDFQSSNAAQLASSYVRRYGAGWGYWLTLENVHFRAPDSLGGEIETDPEEENNQNNKPPIGAWWATSLGLGLVSTTMLILNNLYSAPLIWMRRTSAHLGIIGELLFGAIGIAGICTIWMTCTLIIRWVLLRIQRIAFLPGRINSKKTCQSVLHTIFSRVHRRATTLTLGPLPVISVDDEWWKDVVLRCVGKARLVVFMVTARDSAALNWEMEQVHDLFDPRRILYIELYGNDLHLTDGTGNSIPGTSWGCKEDRIEAAVRRMLVDDE